MAAALSDLIGTNAEGDDDGTRVPAARRLFVAPIINYELEALLGDPHTVHERALAELPSVIRLVATAITSSGHTRE